MESPWHPHRGDVASGVSSGPSAGAWEKHRGQDPGANQATPTAIAQVSAQSACGTRHVTEQSNPH